VADGTPADLYTYDVTVRRVIDGDTIEVAIALPHLVHRLKLRLRGLDCPEMDTPEGKAAKRETEKLVRAAPSATIYTSKPDKYDRYLADVFLAGPSGPSSADPATAEIFLNNHLLEHGFAERKDADDFGDEKFW
jgi:endonuclease YncB( thermonuclease family)